MDKKNELRTNDHLANERTFLAWIRTSIGIMGFGFVVVKFSIFIKRIAYLLNDDYKITSSIPSSYIGIGLVLIGAIICLLGYFNYLRVRREIITQTYQSKNVLINLLTCCIIIINAILVWYLIESTH